MLDLFAKKEAPIQGMMGMGGGVVRFYSASGGDPDGYWFLTSGDTNSNQARNFGIGSDDSIYCLTRKSSTAIISKFDNSGVKQWARNLYGYGSEQVQLFALDVDSNDNVYLSGRTYDPTSGTPSNSMLTKYDSSGTHQYNKIISNSGTLYEGISINSSNNNIITPFTSNNTLNFHEWNTSGAMTGLKKGLGNSGNPSGNGNTFANSGLRRNNVQHDSNGNIYILGESQLTGDRHVFVIKWNSSGVAQYQTSYGNSTNSNDFYGTACALDSSNNFYVVGYSRNTSPENSFILKFNSSGTLQWQKTIGTDQFTEAYAVVCDSEDNIYVSGRTAYNPSVGSGNRMGIWKFNPSGSVLWSNYLVGSGDFEVFDIAVNSYDSVLVFATNRTNTTNSSQDMSILKIPNDGSATGNYSFGSSTLYYGSFTETISNLSHTGTTRLYTAGNSSGNASNKTNLGTPAFVTTDSKVDFSS